MSQSLSVFERQIEKIEKYAEQKAEEQEMNRYMKYHGIFDVVTKELQKHKVLLYGGTAINELMPPELKIYKNFTMPDLDVFTLNGKRLAKRIVDIYRKKGHISSFGDALHENTTKVYVDGIHVLDITQVPRNVFRVLSKNKQLGSLGIPVVNPEFLRMSLHAFLAQPNDAYRWSKVFQRLLNFYKVFPVKPCPKKSLAELQPHEYLQKSVLNEIREVVKALQCIMFGGDVVTYFLFGKEFPYQSWPSHTVYDILVEETPLEVAKQICKLIPHASFDISKVYESDGFCPEHVILRYKKKQVLGIYKNDTCLSYVSIDGFKVANIQTMCRMYMLLLLSNQKHLSKKHIICIVNMLCLMMMKLMSSKNREKMYQTLVLECLGPFEDMITLRRNKIEKGLKNNKA